MCSLLGTTLLLTLVIFLYLAPTPTVHQQLVLQDNVNLVQQRLTGNKVDQCPCVIRPGSDKCVTYDSRYQASTVAEAVVAFPDLSLDQRKSERLSPDADISCQSAECRKCAGTMVGRLRSVGLLRESEQIAFNLNDINESSTDCNRLRFTRRQFRPELPTEIPFFLQETIREGLKNKGREDDRNRRGEGQQPPLPPPSGPFNRNRGDQVVPPVAGPVNRQRGRQFPPRSGSNQGGRRFPNQPWLNQPRTDRNQGRRQPPFSPSNRWQFSNRGDQRFSTTNRPPQNDGRPQNGFSTAPVPPNQTPMQNNEQSRGGEGQQQFPTGAGQIDSDRNRQTEGQWSQFPNQQVPDNRWPNQGGSQNANVGGNGQTEWQRQQQQQQQQQQQRPENNWPSQSINAGQNGQTSWQQRPGNSWSNQGGSQGANSGKSGETDWQQQQQRGQSSSGQGQVPNQEIPRQSQNSQFPSQPSTSWNGQFSGGGIQGSQGGQHFRNGGIQSGQGGQQFPNSGIQGGQGGQQFPNSGIQGGQGGQQFPNGGIQSGQGGQQFPNSGIQGGQGGQQFPNGGIQGGQGGQQFPNGGIQSGQGGQQFPNSGIQGGQGGQQFPNGGIQSGQGGQQFPNGGNQGNQGGLQLPDLSSAQQFLGKIVGGQLVGQGGNAVNQGIEGAGNGASAAGLLGAGTDAAQSQLGGNLGSLLGGNANGRLAGGAATAGIAGGIAGGLLGAGLLGHSLGGGTGATQSLFQGKKRKRRDVTPTSSAGTEQLGQRYIISCITKGEPETNDDPNNQKLSLCGVCWAWRKLPDDYFPQLINELLCNTNNNTDTSCLSGWGTCSQKYKNVNVLRKMTNGTWVPVTVATGTCCDCQVLAGTSFHAMVVGNGH